MRKEHSPSPFPKGMPGSYPERLRHLPEITQPGRGKAWVQCQDTTLNLFSTWLQVKFYSAELVTVTCIPMSQNRMGDPEVQPRLMTEKQENR